MEVQELLAPRQDMAQGHSMEQHSRISQLVTKAAKVTKLRLKQQDTMLILVALHRTSHRQDIQDTRSQPLVDMGAQVQHPVISQGHSPGLRVGTVVGHLLSRRDIAQVVINNLQHQATNLLHSLMEATKHLLQVGTKTKARGDTVARAEQEVAATREVRAVIRVVDTREVEMAVDIKTVEVVEEGDTEVAMEVADQIGVDTVVVVMVIKLVEKPKSTRRTLCLYPISPKL